MVNLLKKYNEVIMSYEDVLKNPEKYSFTVSSLGACSINSPVRGRTFVGDVEQITFASQVGNILALLEKETAFPAFQKAGPRRKIFHDPANSRAGIVTCGGLCPGLNNVIKGLVTVLYHEYGIKSATGFRYGYQGLLKDSEYEPLELTLQIVDSIHKAGGTILGSSRGKQDCASMVDTLERLKINILFCIGGDGTQKGAIGLVDEITKRKSPISVIGIPKTIDNDLQYVEKSFGFETAVHASSEIITSAHNEAEGAENGIAIVKLMGNDSGFIAAASTLANSVVDFCLIPEIGFHLEGSNGLFEALDRRLNLVHHALIVVAEGAGKTLLERYPARKEAWGNTKKPDIGLLLVEEITKYFQKPGSQNVTVKYLDPGYHIRSVPAIPSDAIFCYLLAENAIHAGMAGKTGIVIGHWNNYFTHVPMALATLERLKIDPEGAIWNGVLGATRQNDYFAQY